MNDCLFCRIIAGELPSSKVYEDDQIVAFLDLFPVKKGHTLVVPKKHLENFVLTDDETLLALTRVAKHISTGVMKAVNADGCVVSTNNGKAAGQEVFHLHWHIIPRFDEDGLNGWPHGAYEADEKEEYAAEIRKELEAE